MCDASQVREEVRGVVGDALEIDREEVAPEVRDEDGDLMRRNPCSTWPPVCGQVCISVPHQVKISSFHLKK